MGHVKLAKTMVVDLQNKIFSWWAENRRDLPWRKTNNPYHILVSEIMLQQTQVSRVIPKYVEFIEAFPTVHALAVASPAHVLRVWKGMGYNRRALYLQKAAKMIVEKYHNQFPVSEQLLSELPGVGTYTARAILVFAFKNNIAAVDTNVRRIITHFFFDDKPQKPSVIQKIADLLLPKGKSWEWHQALMDFGALALPRTMNDEPKTKHAPFRQSNRFYRGRIIDRLRDRSYHEKILIREISATYGKQEDTISEIISGLVHDGLVSRNGITVGLPK